MKEIKLSGKYAQGRVILVSDEDFERVNSKNWYYQPPRGRAQELITTSIRKRKILIHRFILGLTNPKQIVDHVDGNRFNNTRENLRLATTSQNSFNRKMHSDNELGFKGVRKKKDLNRAKPYEASIRIHGKVIHIGHYATAEEAAKAYDSKAIELHGEFARLNFPEENT